MPFSGYQDSAKNYQFMSGQLVSGVQQSSRSRYVQVGVIAFLCRLTDALEGCHNQDTRGIVYLPCMMKTHKKNSLEEEFHEIIKPEKDHVVDCPGIGPGRYSAS